MSSAVIQRSSENRRPIIPRLDLDFLEVNTPRTKQSQKPGILHFRNQKPLPKPEICVTSTTTNQTKQALIPHSHSANLRSEDSRPLWPDFKTLQMYMKSIAPHCNRINCEKCGSNLSEPFHYLPLIEGKDVDEMTFAALTSMRNESDFPMCLRIYRDTCQMIADMRAKLNQYRSLDTSHSRMVNKAHQMSLESKYHSQICSCNMSEAHIEYKKNTKHMKPKQRAQSDSVNGVVVNTVCKMCAKTEPNKLSRHTETMLSTDQKDAELQSKDQYIPDTAQESWFSHDIPHKASSCTNHSCPHDAFYSFVASSSIDLMRPVSFCDLRQLRWTENIEMEQRSYKSDFTSETKDSNIPVFDESFTDDSLYPLDTSASVSSTVSLPSDEELSAEQITDVSSIPCSYHRDRMAVLKIRRKQRTEKNLPVLRNTWTEESTRNPLLLSPPNKGSMNVMTHVTRKKEKIAVKNAWADNASNHTVTGNMVDRATSPVYQFENTLQDDDSEFTTPIQSLLSKDLSDITISDQNTFSIGSVKSSKGSSYRIKNGDSLQNKKYEKYYDRHDCWDDEGETLQEITPELKLLSIIKEEKWPSPTECMKSEHFSGNSSKPLPKMEGTIPCWGYLLNRSESDEQNLDEPEDSEVNVINKTGVPHKTIRRLQKKLNGKKANVKNEKNNSQKKVTFRALPKRKKSKSTPSVCKSRITKPETTGDDTRANYESNYGYWFTCGLLRVNKHKNSKKIIRNFFRDIISWFFPSLRKGTIA